MLRLRAGVVLLLRPAAPSGVVGGGSGFGGSGGGTEVDLRPFEKDLLFATGDTFGEGLTSLRGVGGGVWPFLAALFFWRIAACLRTSSAAALNFSCSFASLCFSSSEYSLRSLATSLFSADFERADLD